MRTAAFFICFIKWRCIAISTKELQINEEINATEVRLVGDEGEQIGIVKLADAQNMALDRGLDLVLMAPGATPPVCRIMDYGKFRFERDKKEKEARKKQQVIKIKEIQLSCTIDVHDFNTRVNRAHEFLGSGNKVKINLRFKGREMSHQEVGFEVIERFLTACADVGSADKKPAVEGRNMIVTINPITKKN